MLFLRIVAEKKLDVFSFSQIENAILCPKSEWIVFVMASLRRRHQVLIQNSALAEIPNWDESKRIVVTEEWIWLAPRSFSLIKSEINRKVVSFSELRDQLKNTK